MVTVMWVDKTWGMDSSPPAVPGSLSRSEADQDDNVYSNFLSKLLKSVTSTPLVYARMLTKSLWKDSGNVEAGVACV